MPSSPCTRVLVARLPFPVNQASPSELQASLLPYLPVFTQPLRTRRLRTIPTISIPTYSSTTIVHLYYNLERAFPTTAPDIQTRMLALPMLEPIRSDANASHCGSTPASKQSAQIGVFISLICLQKSLKYMSSLGSKWKLHQTSI
jgi:hypothetical protein